MTDITEQEAQDLLRQYSEGKANVHSFFTNVIKANDTTKTGNLNQDELGMSKLPVRTYKELALFSKEIANEDGWADYFNKMSEIQTAKSLSKDAILIKLSVTNKKELADMTPEKKKNKGWFSRKEETPTQ
jgi:hypothetical protein